MIISPNTQKLNIFVLAGPEDKPVDYSRPVIAYLSGMSSKSSKDVLKRTLDNIASIATGGECSSSLDFPWHLLKYEHTTALRSVFVDKFAPSTGNRFLSALRGVLRAAWKIGYMSAEEYQRAADIRNIRGDRSPAGREIKQSELELVLRKAWEDTTSIGVRDTAILAVLYGLGLRRDEVSRLRLEDYDAEDSSIKIRGKGNKERIVHIPNEFVEKALDRWIRIREHTPGPLFYHANSSKSVFYSCENLSNQVIYYVVKKRFANVGIENVTPHDFRRTYVSALLSAGADLVQVSKLVGHENLQTTARYDRRPDEEKRKAAKSLPQPFTTSEDNQPTKKGI